MDKRRKEINSNLELKLTPSPLKKGKKEGKDNDGQTKEREKSHAIYRVESSNLNPFSMTFVVVCVVCVWLGWLRADSSIVTC